MANQEHGRRSEGVQGGSGFLSDVLRPDMTAPHGVRVVLNGNQLHDVSPATASDTPVDPDEEQTHLGRS